MPESLRTWLMRHAFNLVPAFWGTGGRIAFIAPDWREMRVEIPLRLRTRNYVGTMFGGSMYAAVDPWYMIMLIKVLGPEYVVWDKAASIRFLRPGRSTLTAHFLLEEAELETIRKALETERSVDRIYAVELVDRERTVCARVETTVYVRRKTPAREAPGRPDPAPR